MSTKDNKGKVYMLKNKLQILVTLIFLGFVGWWVSFQHIVSLQGHSVSWFEDTYGVMALIGAIVGFFAIKKWGGIRTVLGKALLFFSLGLLAQEVGQLIYSYYIYVDKIQIPYPSWGDAAYFGSVLFYIIAAIFLTKVVGVKFSLKGNILYKTIAIVLPLLLLVGSYLIVLHNHQFNTSKPLTVFLDAGYPIGEACYISIGLVAYLLSRKMLGGIMKSGILLIIAALVIQYASDFTFVYQSNRNTYVAGKYDDLLYLIAYFAMTTAMIKFHIIYSNLQHKSQAHIDKSKAATADEGGA
jgi:hypothetical protein